jgi:hypothetical protein
MSEGETKGSKHDSQKMSEGETKESKQDRPKYVRGGNQSV